jgi:hypothetical protein
MNFRYAAALALSLLFLAALLLGCAAQGPAYEKVPIVQTKSAVYIYHPYSATPAFTALAIAPPIGIIDCGNFSVHLKAGAYRRFVVDPGAIRCIISDSTVNFTAEPGGDYYIKETIHSGVFGLNFQIEYMTPEDAKDEIAQCKEQLQQP